MLILDKVLKCMFFTIEEAYRDTYNVRNMIFCMK